MAMIFILYLIFAPIILVFAQDLVVVRSSDRHKGDIFIDNIKCDLNCTEFEAIGGPKHRCGCECPSERPMFVQDRGLCMAKIDSCQPFFENEKATFVLPDTGETFDAKLSLNSYECRIIHIKYLTSFGWRELDKSLLDLIELGDDEKNITFGEGTAVRWMGDENERQLLSGKLLKIDVQCHINGAVFNVCSIIRIAGNDGKLPQKLQKTIPKTKLLISLGVSGFGLLCLIIALIGAIAYCWQLQKNKLIEKVLMYQESYLQAPPSEPIPSPVMTNATDLSSEEPPNKNYFYYGTQNDPIIYPPMIGYQPNGATFPSFIPRPVYHPALSDITEATNENVEFDVEAQKDGWLEDRKHSKLYQSFTKRLANEPEPEKKDKSVDVYL